MLIPHWSREFVIILFPFFDETIRYSCYELDFEVGFDIHFLNNIVPESDSFLFLVCTVIYARTSSYIVIFKFEFARYKWLSASH